MCRVAALYVVERLRGEVLTAAAAHFQALAIVQARHRTLCRLSRRAPPSQVRPTRASPWLLAACGSIRCVLQSLQNNTYSFLIKSDVPSIARVYCRLQCCTHQAKGKECNADGGLWEGRRMRRCGAALAAPLALRVFAAAEGNAAVLRSDLRRSLAHDTAVARQERRLCF